MATSVSDTFTDTSATILSSHTGETGATWTQNTALSGTNRRLAISNANRCRQNSDNTTKAYYASGIPATAEYDITADVAFKSVDGVYVGITGRMETAADTGYHLRYSGTAWELRKVVAGTTTVLGSWTNTETDESTVAVKLEIRDATKKAFIAGTERISSSDNEITAAGRVGLRASGSGGSDTVGQHIDNLVAADPAGATTHERSAAITATAAVTAANREFFSILERSAAVAATAAIATAPQRDLLRQAALAATGVVTAAGTFWTEFARSAALAATGSIDTAPQRGLHRQATVSAIGSIEASGQIVGQVTEHERSAALSATSSIASDGHGILERATAVTAVGTISSTGQRDLLRAVQLAASGGFSVGHQRDLYRTAALTAAAAITAAGSTPTFRWDVDPEDRWPEATDDTRWPVTTSSRWT